MRKNFLLTLLIVVLVLSVLTGLNVNMRKVSAVEYPAIMVVPSPILDDTLTPGKNFTVSIDTDYTGSDIWGYDLTLSYNPMVLHGGPFNITDTWVGEGMEFWLYTTRVPIHTDSEKVYVNDTLLVRWMDYRVYCDIGVLELWIPTGVGADIKMEYQWYGISNGDLIQPMKPYGNGSFQPGNFDNDLGKLGITSGFFYYFDPNIPDTATGPGTLMNVTFEVVGMGASNITLGDDTVLKGYDGGEYEIINADSQPDHIQNGFFSNVPLIHDVAVTSLEVPATGVCEQPVPINVTVANQGTYEEDVTVTVYNETSVIDSTIFTLTTGLINTVSFSWVTSGVGTGSYKIHANATITTDGDPGDNNQTKSVTLSYANDVAVVSLDVPDTVAIEQPAPISVTVANEGSYAETVTLTVYNETSVIDSTSFPLAKGPTSNTVDFSWNTSGVDTGSYKIKANATITTDDEPGDNNQTKSVTLSYANDVAVVSLDVPTKEAVNQLVPISVTVANEGSYAETVTVTVYNETSVINSTSFGLAKGPTSNTVDFSWNTSGVGPGQYTIKANATISLDDDPGDNNQTAQINLLLVNDVAVINVTAPERGDVDDTVFINVTVKNVGSYSETFNVTAYYDDTAIVLTNGKINTTVTLEPAESSILELAWNTTGVTFGAYTIIARASLVEGEPIPQYNNGFIDGSILITLRSDIRGPDGPDYLPDGVVDILDFAFIGLAYGKSSADPDWETYKVADTRGPDPPYYLPDGVVDILDFAYCGLEYGKSCL